MRKPPTGEPCAGEPHARFGGRGGFTLPDPYHCQDISNRRSPKANFYNYYILYLSVWPFPSFRFYRKISELPGETPANWSMKVKSSTSRLAYVTLRWTLLNLSVYKWLKIGIIWLRGDARVMQAFFSDTRIGCESINYQM